MPTRARISSSTAARSARSESRPSDASRVRRRQQRRRAQQLRHRQPLVAVGHAALHELIREVGVAHGEDVTRVALSADCRSGRPRPLASAYPALSFDCAIAASSADEWLAAAASAGPPCGSAARRRGAPPRRRGRRRRTCAAGSWRGFGPRDRAHSALSVHDHAGHVAPHVQRHLVERRCVRPMPLATPSARSSWQSSSAASFLPVPRLPEMSTLRTSGGSPSAARARQSRRWAAVVLEWL